MPRSLGIICPFLVRHASRLLQQCSTIPKSVWYVADEFGADLFEQELKNKPMPGELVIKEVSSVPRLAPRMQSSRNASQAWLTILSILHQDRIDTLSGLSHHLSGQIQPARCPQYGVISTEDKVLAGLLAQQPGKLWRYMTGHLKLLKTTTNSRLPPIAATLMISPASRFQPFGVTSWSRFSSIMGWLSVSDMEVSADGCSRCQDNVSMPPDPLKPLICRCSSLRKISCMAVPHALLS